MLRIGDVLTAFGTPEARQELEGTIILAPVDPTESID
jgi:hypothetical protein